MALDDDIDRLYQLPLAEFTAARDALAKQAGADAPAVKTLQKPNAAAWALNQLYWRRRKVFDQLVAAARARREAHARLLHGKGSDVVAAEGQHAERIKAATVEMRALLQEAGDSASPATMIAVADTLQALPTADRPGRLTRPLKPQGFEALVGLVPQSDASGFAGALRLLEKKAAPASTPAAQSTSAKPDRREQEAARRAAQAKAREAAAVEQQLGAARTAERQALAELARVRRAREKADRLRERLTAELDAAIDEATRAADALHREERRANEATAARERLEFRLGALRTPT